MEDTNIHTLTEWAVVHLPSTDQYKAPEQNPTCLSGTCDHPKFGKAARIRTSPIVNTDGRTIYTMTGSVYILHGGPSAEYSKWLADRELTFDPLNPIKFRHR